MNTNKTLRVRLYALAAASLALTSAVAPIHAADTRPVTPLNGWNGKLGPGLGSTKTPFGVIETGHSIGGMSDAALYFHTSTGKAAQQLKARRLGPGPWSVKSPGSDRF